MEVRPEKLRKYSAVLAASFGLAALNGCGPPDSEPQPPSQPVPVSRLIDRDGDGAPNNMDPYPHLANPGDWDVDNLLNAHDPQPYKWNTTASNPGRTNQIPSPIIPNQRPGCLQDRDCDTAPDSEDEYPNIHDFSDADKDSDSDGLKDSNDSSPHSRDRDGDGYLDGYDPNPAHLNDTRSEFGDESPYKNDKDEDNDGEDDAYDSEPSDPSVQ